MGKDTPPPVNRAELIFIFLKIGLLSFGGPAAQIALMHRLLVDEQKWLSERQYMNALSFCMLLPGPEAMQLATYSGWRLHGIFGGLVAGLLFVMPGALVIFALATVYVTYGDLPIVKTLFLGVQAVAVVIVVEALLRVAKRALTENIHRVIAVLAFVGIFFFAVPFPIIVVTAAVVGAVIGKKTSALPSKLDTSLRKSALTLIIGLIIWALPVVLLDMLFGQSILTELGVFFSKLAAVTFGGAYAVLAYMAQDVVVEFGWLSASEMMDGLGLAETTPGPLILVTEFVGFLAAFREGGFAIAIAGTFITLWVTFVPCFVWIFVGAPYIEWISAQPRLNSALKSITAAVVGVILNLSLWFALHVVFANVTEHKTGIITVWVPDLWSVNPHAVILIALSAFLLLKMHRSIGLVLAISAICALGLDAIAEV